MAQTAGDGGIECTTSPAGGVRTPLSSAWAPLAWPAMGVLGIGGNDVP